MRPEIAALGCFFVIAWLVEVCLGRGRACWLPMGWGELGVWAERVGKVYFGFFVRKSGIFEAA